MSCERYAGAIVDHACGAEVAPDARRHLETCDACRVRFDEQRRMIAALDSELQTALAIEPSPYFERKVRARIAETAPASPRGFWWAVAAAALVIIVLGLAAIRSRDDSTVVAPADVARVAPQAQPAHTNDPRPGPAPTPVRDEAPVVVKRTPNPATHRLPKPVESSLPEVEVIVSAEQSKAIERYMALLRSGTIDTSNLAKETPAGNEPRELIVAPLEVQPLTVADVEIRNSPVVDRRGPQ